MNYETPDTVIEQAYQSARKALCADGRSLEPQEEDAMRAGIAGAAATIANAALRKAHAEARLSIRTPEVPPLGWPITRLTIEDMWRLFVAPSEHEPGVPTPEVRALAALLREVYLALPENPEARRYLPTELAAPAHPLRFVVGETDDPGVL